MAAPTLSTRGTPSAPKLKDGFSTKISFSANTTVVFYEKDVKPPGMDGGPEIDNTTMLNTSVTTKRAQALINYESIQTKVAYHPSVYGAGQVLSLINQEGSVTVQFPDGATLTFYGYLQKFEPSPLVKGSQPEAEITIVVTNWDPVNNVEVAPVYVNVAS